MEVEKRSGNINTQDGLKKRLNEEQMLTLQQMEAAGWELYFIRSRFLLPPIITLKHIRDGDIVVLEEDGSINQHHGLIIRKDESVPNK